MILLALVEAFSLLRGRCFLNKSRTDPCWCDQRLIIQERGEFVMAEVKVTDSFEKALKVFKRQCQREGFLMQIKEKRYYSKPSEVKRRKKSRSKQFSG